jgi:hypothetical protein
MTRKEFEYVLRHDKTARIDRRGKLYFVEAGR